MVETHQPEPGVDFPQNGHDLEEMFASEADCHRYLERVRYPRGFACERCGSRQRPWRSGTGLLACCACRHPHPLTAHTLFHASPIPLTRWMRGLWAVADRESGASPTMLAEQLGMSQRPTDRNRAEAILGQIRAAMARAADAPLEGEVYVTTTRLALDPNTPEAEQPVVAMALDVERGDQPQLRLGHLPRVTSREIQRFVVDHVAPCSRVVTAPWKGFSLLGSSGYDHEIKTSPPPLKNGADHGTTRGLASPADIWSLLRLWLWSTPSVPSDGLQPRLDDFVFRFNRRHYPRGQLFYRLVRLAMEPNQAPPLVASAAAGGPAVDAPCDPAAEVGATRGRFAAICVS